MTALRRLYRRLTGKQSPIVARVAAYTPPQPVAPLVWTCLRCGVTSAHATCPTLRCKGTRP